MYQVLANTPLLTGLGIRVELILTKGRASADDLAIRPVVVFKKLRENVFRQLGELPPLEPGA